MRLACAPRIDAEGERHIVNRLKTWTTLARHALEIEQADHPPGDGDHHLQRHIAPGRQVA